MRESRLWHILIVISSLRTCIKFFEGEASNEDYIRVRMFPNNFEYIGVSDRIEGIMDEARKYELPMNKHAARVYYVQLEKEFIKLFHEEITKGIPEDVSSVNEDDAVIGDIKKVLLNLRL